MNTNDIKIWLCMLTASSLIVACLKWSSLGFTHTATMGAGAVILYCISFGFSGALAGGLLSLLWMLGLRIFTGKKEFPFAILFSIWTLFQLAAYYAVYMRYSSQA